MSQGVPYGKDLRGVGGMNKTVFAHDGAAVDAEIAQLRPSIETGGYIPCPDHRIAPDAKFENLPLRAAVAHALQLTFE